MSNAIQVYTPDKIELIRKQLCPTATDTELQYFIAVAQGLKLNPLTGQIRAIKRWTKDGPKLSIEVGIDGWRLKAQETGRYRGNIGPEWCGPDGQWVSIWLSREPPVAARYAVLVEGWSQPCWGTALYRSFVATGKDGKVTGKWLSMPEQMLALCAERQAIRRAFPMETMGIPDEREPMVPESMDAEVMEHEHEPTRTEISDVARRFVASHGEPEPEPEPEPTPIETINRAIDVITGECERLGLDANQLIAKMGPITSDASHEIYWAWRQKALDLYRDLRDRPTPPPPEPEPHPAPVEQEEK